MTGTQQRPFPVDDLLRAVRLEITAELRSDGDGEKVSLTTGRRVGGDGEIQEYLFSCRSWKDSFSGEKLLVRLSRSRASWVSAEAVRMPDGKVTVRTAADLSSRPDNAQLRKDESAGMEALAERLESAGGSDGLVNLTTAGWMLGQGSPRVNRCATPERFIRGYRERELNPRQRQAIEQALDSELTFIWGPPGTGKTDVVASIVEGCYRQGMRVLFVAPTKVAVDQALERICDLLSGEEGFDTGLVQRAGDIELASLATRFGDQINAGRIAGRLFAAVTARITETRELLDAARQDLALHAEAERVSGELRDLSARRDEAGRHAAALRRQIQAGQAALARTEQQIHKIGTPSGLFAKKKQAKLDDLGRVHRTHRNAVAALDQQLHTALTVQRNRATEVAKREPELAVLHGRLRRVPPPGPLRDAVERLQQQLSALEQEQQKITEAVRSNCRVMGATVAKAVQSRTLLDSIDVVVIDEAGMVNTPSAWCAAGLAARRVVVAGDFRQLPAVTKSSGDREASPEDRQHAVLWMDRDVFATAGLVDPVGSARQDRRMVCLDTQYRMRPSICEVVNVVAYPDAPLRTGRGDRSRLPHSPLIDGPLILVDTTPRRLPNPKGRRNGHKTNPVHEAVIHELVRGLQYDEVLPARKWTNLAAGERPADRLAVIAPFRDQVKALRNSLTYRFGESYEGLVDTVHRFQGSQRPLVVIDTVAGAGDRLGYFYEGSGLSSSTCRLLNVALSRAQDHLVVVADTLFLHDNLSPGSEAAQMLAHLERHARLLSVDELVPFRCAADLAGLDKDELARPAFFPADEVSRAIAWDIEQAQRSIEIYCAFLDPVPVGRWLRHLTPRIENGVQVTVHTRDQADDPRRRALVRDLEAAGCLVAVRERMHEKVMIVDDTVLWHGSLNLLANTGATDLMMRITDPSSCRQVRHIVDRARMERPARTWKQTSPEPDSAPDVRTGDVLDGRLYIQVPFDKKDEFKHALQAAGIRPQWHGARKLWHVDATVPRHLVQRWLPPARN
ncbi:AAA domain-containing protein [Streptosporangium sp. NBC_01810]|uniref:AAA domain-containing protein n=1 Tax=Streptosporangium sp. NBC_01810 TaxID=2975951 RepID=UPI002DD97C15|nr:AAA domain-containing protein [Streptosporangium sp. NBC_01810]WSA23317.1 AAA domain-containing protein [Streptosporangium sp. NBC_01810]